MYVCMYVYICMHVCMYVCMYVCIYAYICMYVCMYILCKNDSYVCIYVCIHSIHELVRTMWCMCVLVESNSTLYVRRFFIYSGSYRREFFHRTRMTELEWFQFLTLTLTTA